MPRQKKSQNTLSQTKAEESDQLNPALVNEALKIIFILDASKKPLKISDVVGQLSEKPKRNQQRLLWDRIQEELAIFGLELVDVPNSNTRMFFLINKMAEEPIMYKHTPKAERAERTLLILILAFIFMKEGPITEDELFRHLQQLQIFGNTREHEYFGDVKQKITGKFVEQLYLTRTIAEGQEIAQFQWGPRAEIEVSKASVLDFVCKIAYGGRVKPEQWTSHYQQVQLQAEAAEDAEEEDDDDDE